MKDSVKTITLILGALGGAFLGYKVAQSFIEEAETAQASTLPITASQGLRLGMTALDFFKRFRNISTQP